ncbi:PorP/SprF family type IX secretion system membrane protein [Eisenibacter elegans]|uniref:PorP/SprF family type IX secretion system membrane protein n=1 Tax=Eisenibacter elegans TaxID=997 RepID=UPI00040D7430|nr:type IX secretion system membrane protein PorP/SprF [Eisenibacter elegans]
MSAKLPFFIYLYGFGLWLFTSLLCYPLYAQQDPQFSLFLLNRQYLNPAYTGSEYERNISLTHRSQWAGYNPSFDQGGAPVTQVLLASTRIPLLRSGIGLTVVNDAIGAQINREVQLSYAYHFKLPIAELSLGLSGGIQSRGLDFNRLRPVDNNDPIIGQGDASQILPDLHAGIYYKREQLFIGASVRHLNEPNYNFGFSDQQNLLKRSAYLMAGYEFRLAYAWYLTPSALIKSDFSNFSVDINAIAAYQTYNTKFWGGFAYRYQDAFSVIVGSDFAVGNNQMRLGYAFDYVPQGQVAKSPTSHEINVAYILPVAPLKKPTIIRTPRFRY